MGSCLSVNELELYWLTKRHFIIVSDALQSQNDNNFNNNKRVLAFDSMYKSNQKLVTKHEDCLIANSIAGRSNETI